MGECIRLGEAFKLYICIASLRIQASRGLKSTGRVKKLDYPLVHIFRRATPRIHSHIHPYYGFEAIDRVGRALWLYGRARDGLTHNPRYRPLSPLQNSATPSHLTLSRATLRIHASFMYIFRMRGGPEGSNDIPDSRFRVWTVLPPPPPTHTKVHCH